MRPFLSSLFLLSLLFGEEIVTPIPAQPDVNIQKAKLGKMLFLDTRLSRDGSISCATCHDIHAHGGAEFKEVSEGVAHQKGDANAPTVLNAVFNIAQFWDGRAKDLIDQAKGPILNPVEMDNNFKSLVPLLGKDPEYAWRFQACFKDGLNEDTIAEAIAEYEKTLITPGSRFDRFLLGENDAMSAEEKAGFSLFKSKGCISCHHGVNLGGNQFQRFGAVIPNDTIGTSSKGRFNVTKDADDLYYLKVPTLRNIAETSPYFHDGSVKTLFDAVRLMSYHQLGIELETREIDQIVKFLSTLSAPVYKDGNVD